MNWPRAGWSLSEGGAIQRFQSVGGKEGAVVCARKRLRRAPAPPRHSQVMASGPTEDERGGKELSSPSSSSSSSSDGCVFSPALAGTGFEPAERETIKGRRHLLVT